MTARLTLIVLALIVGACSTTQAQSPETLALFGSSSQQGDTALEDYRIGALDVLSVTVFQVEDLSFEEIHVNAAGNLQLPLIGTIRAQGLTAEQLSTEIADRLAGRYLRSPQVSVTVTEAASQKVTVDGAVTEPGVFQMKGRTTLLQAIAMAKGADRAAALDRVVVFRNIDGQRMAARFDVREIRAGRLADPVLLGDDVVIVDTSFSTAAIREVFALLPSLAIFAAY